MPKEIQAVEQFVLRRERLSSILEEGKALVERRSHIALEHKNGTSLEAKLEYGNYNKASKVVERTVNGLSERLKNLDRESETSSNEASEINEQRLVRISPVVDAIFPLNKEQRTSYKDGIKPYVNAAREAYRPMFEIREQRRLNRVPGSPKANTSVTREIKEDFRIRANELIAKGNQFRAELFVTTGVNPMTTSLHRIPQIPPPESTNAFVKPNSPVKPHNALDTLSIYRRKEINPILAGYIRKEADDLKPTNSNANAMSLAIVSIIPQHFIEPLRSVPNDLRDKKQLAKGIVGITDLVVQFDTGILLPPTEEELGSLTKKQDEHIITYLRTLLAYHLKDELTNPNRTETELQDFYQKMNNHIRFAARHITPRHGDEEDSYERIGALIEDMPGLEGAMLSTRLSTSLYQDLRLPCLEYTGEIRLAEIMRNIGNSGYWSYNSLERSRIFHLPEKSRILLDKIVDSIYERMEMRDIDLPKLFGSLEALDYGEYVIENMLKILDLDHREIFIRALKESNCFISLARGTERAKDEYNGTLDRFV